MAKYKEHKKIQTNPMIYVVQPTFQPATVNIQRMLIIKPNQEINTGTNETTRDIDNNSEVISDKVIETKEEHLKNIGVDSSEVKIEQKEVHQEKAVLIEKNVDIPSVENDNTKGYSYSELTTKRTSKKPFQKMNIDEKINYLIYKPGYIPTVKCQIKTNDKTIVGNLVSENEKVLKVNTPNEIALIEIPRAEIVDIEVALG